MNIPCELDPVIVQLFIVEFVEPIQRPCPLFVEPVTVQPVRTTSVPPFTNTPVPPELEMLQPVMFTVGETRETPPEPEFETKQLVIVMELDAFR
jgi:hypothetical protein